MTEQSSTISTMVSSYYFRTPTEQPYQSLEEPFDAEMPERKKDARAFRAIAWTLGAYTFVDIYLTAFAFYCAQLLMDRMQKAMWTFFSLLFALDTAAQSRLWWLAMDFENQESREDVEAFGKTAFVSFMMHMFSILMLFVYQSSVVMSSADGVMSPSIIMSLLFSPIIRLSKLLQLWRVKLGMDARKKDGNWKVVHSLFIAKEDPRMKKCKKHIHRWGVRTIACGILGKLVLILLRRFNIPIDLGMSGPSPVSDSHSAMVMAAMNNTVVGANIQLFGLAGHSSVSDSHSAMVMAAMNNTVAGGVAMPLPAPMMLDECLTDTTESLGAGCSAGATVTVWDPLLAPIGCGIGGIIGAAYGC